MTTAKGTARAARRRTQTGSVCIELNGFTPRQLDAAKRRLGIVKIAEQFARAHAQAGGKLSEGFAMYAAKQGISVRTLCRWRQRFGKDGLAGLVDTRGGARSDGEAISEAAWDMFCSMYLTEQQRSVKICWQNLSYVNTSEKRGWRIPPLRTMQRLAAETIPLPVRVLHREGLAAYQAKCAPFIITDPDSVEPGAVWVGDHHQFNLWVRDRGKWVRPWLTGWMDMRSRYLMGWHISTQPNQTTILLAMKRGVKRHGPPDMAKIDNGRDYDSELWTGTTKVRRRRAAKAGYLDEQLMAGIYAMMGTAVSFATPYHPQSKSIERFFDTMDCHFAKLFKTYCGKDVKRRPEALTGILRSKRGIAEGLRLAEFSEKFGEYAELYNNTVHTGNGMNGRTPAEVLAKRTRKRVMKEGVLELLMRVWSGELVIGKNGVRFKGLWFGQFDPELIALQGKKVRVSYDPDDLRRVYVYDAATWQFITIAEQAKFVAYGRVGEEDLRAATREKNRVRRAVKEFRKVSGDELDLASLTLRAMEQRTEPEPEPQPVISGR